jgi:hypothetical protein
MRSLRSLLAVTPASLLLLAGTASAAPSTTVVISEVRTKGPNGGADEVVELTNVSASPVDISKWVLNGSSDTGVKSIRATVPANVTLQPGAFYLIVGTAYQGKPAADVKMSSGVSDAGGVAILDAMGVIVDQVGFSTGSGYKEGTPLKALGSDTTQSYQRKGTSCAPLADTDDNSADFVLLTATPTALASCCGDEKCTAAPAGCFEPAGKCTAGACAYPPLACPPKPAACVDASTSRAFTASCDPQSVSCVDASTDTACPIGCDAATGLCLIDKCAGVVCDKPPSGCHEPAGACAAGVCTYAPKAAGTACDDGDPCTSGDACDAAATCSGTALVCDQAPAASCQDSKTSWSYEAAGTCAAGQCAYKKTVADCPVVCDPATGLCSDDLCIGVACDAPPAGCFLPGGTCEAGKCVYPKQPVGDPCDDGDACTTGDGCSATGACMGTPVDCYEPPPTACADSKTSRSFAKIGFCSSAAGGTCTYAPTDTPCAFGCEGSTGLCMEDPCAGVACDSPPSPCVVAMGKCTDGTCAYAPLAKGAPCNDGLDCTKGEACDGKGACLAPDVTGCAGGAAGAAGQGAGGAAGASGAAAGGAGGLTGGSGGASTAGAAGAAGGAGAGAAGTAGAAGDGQAGADDLPDTGVDDRTPTSACQCRAPGRPLSSRPVDDAGALLAGLALCAAGARRRRRLAPHARR